MLLVQFDASILGLDEESQRRKTPYIGSTAPAVGGAIGTPAHANGSTPGGPSPAGDDGRPKRLKKRRNDDGDDDNGVNGSVGGVASGGGGGNHGPGLGVGPGAAAEGVARDKSFKQKKKRKKVIIPS